MKFGLYSSIANPPRGEHLDRCIDEVIAEAQLAVPMEERAARFEESIEILRLCWAGERFSYRGKHYTLDDVQIRPRPYQKPGPPLWIGASVPAAARRAGRIADGFVGTPSTSLSHATALADIYKEAARKAGRGSEVVQMRDAWVAPTRADADLVYGPDVLAADPDYWEHP